MRWFVVFVSFIVSNVGFVALVRIVVANNVTIANMVIAYC